MNVTAEERRRAKEAYEASLAAQREKILNDKNSVEYSNTNAIAAGPTGPKSNEPNKSSDSSLSRRERMLEERKKKYQNSIVKESAKPNILKVFLLSANVNANQLLYLFRFPIIQKYLWEKRKR